MLLVVIFPEEGGRFLARVKSGAADERITEKGGSQGDGKGLKRVTASADLRRSQEIDLQLEIRSCHLGTVPSPKQNLWEPAALLIYLGAANQ